MIITPNGLDKKVIQAFIYGLIANLFNCYQYWFL